MKKFALIGITLCWVALGFAKENVLPLTGKALDYSRRDNWMFLGDNVQSDRGVDLFYLYPTSAPDRTLTIIAQVTPSMKRTALFNYLRSAECMAKYTNVYAPYYRQIALPGIMLSTGAVKFEEMLKTSVVRTDVYAALDHYFKYHNRGRAFILAGHSQGAFLLKIVLAEYMKIHPEYLKRMIACYAIGCYFPESWFRQNPHIKKATGERDVNVLISWNAEGPGAQMHHCCVNEGSFNINPLNWKTDQTPAGRKANLGALEIDPRTWQRRLVPGKVGAKIDLKRGTLVCEGDVEPLPVNPFFGDKSFHFNDWDFFYRNIQENAKKRIDAYFGK